MRLAEAKAVRDLLKDAGMYATVPLGNGPAGYFARIFRWDGAATVPKDFASLAEAEQYMAERSKRVERERMRLARPRSALDRMIDAACGVTPDTYE